MGTKDKSVRAGAGTDGSEEALNDKRQAQKRSQELANGQGQV
jgi:hypothetical protein